MRGNGARYDQARAAHLSGRSWQTHRRGGAGTGVPFDLGGLGGIDFDGLGRGSAGAGGFSDFFESLFGRRRQPGEYQGRDLEQEIEVTLAEAYAGTARTFSLQVPGPCPACAGSGRAESMVCMECRGSGSRMRNRRLDVKIPAGVRDDSRIRVAGEGHPGRNGERGNLFLIVKIAPDSRFELQSDDLHVNVDIDLVDAVVGRRDSGAHTEWQECAHANSCRDAEWAGVSTRRPRHAATEGRRAWGALRESAGSPAQGANAARKGALCRTGTTAQGQPGHGIERAIEISARSQRGRLGKSMNIRFEGEGPFYAIGVVAEVLRVHPQTLRHYERLGLVKPRRSKGNVRLYSHADLERMEQIQRLVNDLGVNLAGVEVILNITERMERLQQEMDERLAAQRQQYEAEIARLKGLLQRVTQNY